MEFCEPVHHRNLTIFLSDFMTTKLAFVQFHGILVNKGKIPQFSHCELATLNPSHVLQCCCHYWMNKTLAVISFWQERRRKRLQYGDSAFGKYRFHSVKIWKIFFCSDFPVAIFPLESLMPASLIDSEWLELFVDFICKCFWVISRNRVTEKF